MGVLAAPKPILDTNLWSTRLKFTDMALVAFLVENGDVAMFLPLRRLVVDTGIRHARETARYRLRFDSIRTCTGLGDTDSRLRFDAVRI